MPHDCWANSLDLLFDKDQSHIVGIVQLAPDERNAHQTIIGKPSPAELACLHRPAMQSNLAPSCPQVFP